jgi:predicted Zn-ribbon and HTH transcriptional regulator
MKHKCPRCGYEWDSRVDDPKACPRCKSRLDSPYRKVNE